MDRFDTLAASWDIAPIHLDRTRAVARALKARIPLQGLRALEAGAGTGLLGFALAEDLASIELCDPSSGMVEILRRKVAEADLGAQLSVRQVGDDLAGVEGPIDLVALQMALHHVPDVPAFLARAYSLLVPGGFLAVADLDLEDGSFHGPEVTDVHFGFDRDQLGAQCRTAGFEAPAFETAHVMVRAGREYPVFLLVARRPA